MIRRPPRSTHCISSAASDVYKRQILGPERAKKLSIGVHGFAENREIDSLRLGGAHRGRPVLLAISPTSPMLTGKGGSHHLHHRLRSSWICRFWLPQSPSSVRRREPLKVNHVGFGPRCFGGASTSLPGRQACGRLRLKEHDAYAARSYRATIKSQLISLV